MEPLTTSFCDCPPEQGPCQLVGGTTCTFSTNLSPTTSTNAQTSPCTPSSLPWEDPLCGAWETEEKAHALQPPAQTLLDWAPALLPLCFQGYIFYFVIQQRKWMDLAWTITFCIHSFLTYLLLLEVKASWAFSSWSGSWKATGLCG